MINGESIQDVLANLDWGGKLDYLELEQQLSVSNVSTFESAGVLTRNKGIVLKFESGEEFQITIVRSG